LHGTAAIIAVAHKVTCPDVAQVRHVSPARLRAFHAVTAVTCFEEEKTYPGGRKGYVDVRQVAISGLPRLQRAMEEKSTGVRNARCASGAFVAAIALVSSSGATIAPVPPIKKCTPLPSFMRALSAIKWHTVSTVKVTAAGASRA
jgi:hypothetical protein